MFLSPPPMAVFDMFSISTVISPDIFFQCCSTMTHLTWLYSWMNNLHLHLCTCILVLFTYSWASHKQSYQPSLLTLLTTHSQMWQQCALSMPSINPSLLTSPPLSSHCGHWPIKALYIILDINFTKVLDKFTWYKLNIFKTCSVKKCSQCIWNESTICPAQKLSINEGHI